MHCSPAENVVKSPVPERNGAGIWRHCGCRRQLLCGLVLGLWAMVFAGNVSVLAATTSLEGQLPEVDLKNLEESPAFWPRNFDGALNEAAANYKPVLVLFSSPNCGWCRKLKNKVFPNKKVQDLLAHFVRVEVDVTEKPGLARQYGVYGVPVTMILTGDGRVQRAVPGFIEAEALVQNLKAILSPALVDEDSEDIEKLVELLGSGALEAEHWPKLMKALGRDDRGYELHKKILALDPFPAAQLVRLLEHAGLAIRIGALQILEEKSGRTFGFDPWQPPGETQTNRRAVQEWQAWAQQQDTESNHNVYAALTSERLKVYMRDLTAGNRERASRAVIMLQRGGDYVLQALQEYLRKHPDLTPEARRRIREVRYMLILADTNGLDPAVAARRLVYGNLDRKIKALNAVQQAGKRALLILNEYLQNDNAMLREAAVDVLLKIDSRAAVKKLEKHLEAEKGVDVKYVILRGLGGIRRKSALQVLTSYLDHPNEDLVLAALQSIAKLDAKTAATDVRPCLRDKRWRVRAQALETAGNLRAKSLAEEAVKLLDDPDEFVRFKAVKAIIRLGDEQRAKKVAARLEKVFLRDDKLKPEIVKAFYSLNVQLPDSFKKELRNPDLPNEVLLSVLETLRPDPRADFILPSAGRETAGDSDKDASMEIAAEFVNHENLDVACVAARVLAAGAMVSDKYQHRVASLLEAAETAKVTAVLEALDLENDRDPWSTANSGVTDTDVQKAAQDETVSDLFGAFSGNSDEAEKDDESTPDMPPYERLVEAVKKYIAPKHDAQLRRLAAMRLLEAEKQDGLDYLVKNRAQLTDREGAIMAANLRRFASDVAIPIFTRLLQDPSANVRRNAVQAMLDDKHMRRGMPVVFTALLKNKTRLKLADISDCDFKPMANNEEVSEKFRAVLVRMLEKDEYRQFVNFALIHLPTVWAAADEARVLEYVQSEKPLRRRAAYYALGKGAPATLKKYVPKITSDPDKDVRAVIPYLYAPGPPEWVHYYSKKVTNRSYGSWVIAPEVFSRYGYEKSAVTLGKAGKKALHELTSDSAPELRLKAYLCLLANREAVDLRGMIHAVEAVPDQRGVREYIHGFLMYNVDRLGPKFAVLMRYVDKSRLNAEELATLKKNLQVDDDTEEDAAAELVWKQAAESDAATGKSAEELRAVDDDAEESSDTAPIESPPIHLVFFYSPGCDECDAVEDMLGRLKKDYPKLQIEPRNIRKAADMRLNEVLCRKFGVPEKEHLVTPAVFAGAGYLGKNDLSFKTLGQLVAYSRGIPPDNWYVVKQQELEEADAAITGNSSALDLGVILGAALLDSINPCAFATIIFFVSYLQISRRRKSQIIQVCLAFIAGVFITYFILGLGLAETVMELRLIQKLGDGLNWVMVLFVGLIAALNIKDGILCLQGRHEEMSLKLPEWLRARIHRTIREGARHRRFVTAELRTLSYLVAYNVVFVSPLLLILVLTWFGLRSETLTSFLKKHAAPVKFATAGLFLIMLAAFIIAG